MNRECREYYDSAYFSNNQWNRGAGQSRCRIWVEASSSSASSRAYYSYSYNCEVCGKSFPDENQLTQHKKVHRPKDTACPICREVRFASSSNVVAHVESGHCPGCPGKEVARDQLFRFVNRHAPSLLVPRIEFYGHDARDQTVPQYPYRCTYCNKQFAALSSQMNHENDVHSYDRNLYSLTYY